MHRIIYRGYVIDQVEPHAWTIKRDDTVVATKATEDDALSWIDAEKEKRRLQNYGEKR